MQDKLLELETRRELYELIQRNPGLHMRELSRQSGLLPSLVEYHLRHLIKFDLVLSVKEQGYTRFYASSENDGETLSQVINGRQKKVLHLVRQEVALSIILIILEKTSIKHKDILDEVNVSGSTLSYYLKKLVEAEILIHIRTGVEKGYRIKDKEELIKILIMGRIKAPSLVDGFINTWDDFL
jgi:predicted transcriptional regulator